MERKSFLNSLGLGVLGTSVFANTYSKKALFEQSSYDNLDLFEDILGATSKIIVPALTATNPELAAIIGTIETIGNFMGEEGKGEKETELIVKQALEALKGLKDYSGDFDNLVNYHRKVQQRLDQVDIDLENIIVNQGKIDESLSEIGKRQFRILEKLDDNQRLLEDMLSELENNLKGVILTRPYNILNYIISQGDSTGIANWSVEHKKQYEINLSEILRSEFRPRKILELPSYVSISLFNDRINNLDLNQSFKTYKEPLENLKNNVKEIYDSRNQLFLSLISKLYWWGGNGFGRRFIDRETCNIQFIENFSTQEVRYNWISSQEGTRTKKNLDYVKPRIMAASQDRDSFFTTLLATQSFYSSLYDFV